MTNKTLRIGTRDSVLATWQAQFVANHLKKSGCRTELCFIKTEGDRVLDTPLPLMGGKGVFTSALDDALLAGEIDLAVHSLKDIPTRLPDGLAIGAVSQREDTSDVLVTRQRAQELASVPVPGSAETSVSRSAEIRVVSDEDADKNTDAGTDAPAGRNKAEGGGIGTASQSDDAGFLSRPDYQAVIASSSNRRIGQWLARYPHHRMTDIRGNVQTRLRKLRESNWDGAVFAAAGLIRLGMGDHISVVLDWMLPAPGQGAMAVMIREDDTSTRKAIQTVHDPVTALCTAIERDVLHTLEGGCSAPVGALAMMKNGMVSLKINTVYPDGRDMIMFEMHEAQEAAASLGMRGAEEALRRGADKLIRDLRQGD